MGKIDKSHRIEPQSKRNLHTVAKKKKKKKKKKKRHTQGKDIFLDSKSRNCVGTAMPRS
ncbi:hypothetical protein I7I48_06495 [Histoplasma ohiense]|nr:hypothetical protein I7I48_06495 [Histoplasma ohiense (nom. inval.)]